MGCFKFEAITFEAANTEFIKQAGITIDDLKKIDTIQPYNVLSRLDNWENMPDDEILSEIDIERLLSQTLYVLTDISFINNIVFKTTANVLKQFMCLYVEKYNESFFNGDVILLAIEKKQITYFQHDGFWLLYPINSIK